jgi:hypothetical protein
VLADGVRPRMTSSNRNAGDARALLPEIVRAERDLDDAISAVAGIDTHSPQGLA